MPLSNGAPELIKQMVTKEEFHKEVASIRVAIADSKAEVLRWMFIFWIAQFAATIALFKYLLSH